MLLFFLFLFLFFLYILSICKENNIGFLTLCKQIQTFLPLCKNIYNLILEISITNSTLEKWRFGVYFFFHLLIFRFFVYFLFTYFFNFYFFIIPAHCKNLQRFLNYKKRTLTLGK